MIIKNKCRILLTLLNTNDSIRFPFGFSVINGQLLKRATPTSAASIDACKAWAGVDCMEGSGLADHIKLLKQIEEAKTDCNKGYDQWLKGGTKSASFKKWDPKADSRCPLRPPITDPNTCNTQGCFPGLKVWGLDGEFVGFDEKDYKRALEEKYGRDCTDWVEQNKLSKYTNNPQDIPAKLDACKGQEFWFYKGVDLGTKKKFDKQICSDNLEIAKTTDGIREVRGCGSKTYYFCDNKIKDSEKEYKECSCDLEKYHKAEKGEDGAFTTKETGAKGCGDYWICDGQQSTEENYNEKCNKKDCPPKFPKACARTGLDIYCDPAC